MAHNILKFLTKFNKKYFNKVYIKKFKYLYIL